MQKLMLVGCLSVLVAAGCMDTADGQSDDEWTEQLASPWTAPVSLSVPIPPTDVVENPAVAVNAAGAEVAAWDDQAADGTQFVHVRTSADGVHFSPPTTLGHGVEPAVALAPDGRAVAVWIGLSTSISGTLQASVRPPGRAWSTPVQVSPDAGLPHLGIDGAGNAIAVWASPGGVKTASLPAGGSWSAVRTLATGGSAPDLAVNASGAAVVTWTGTGSSIIADSGTVLRGFMAPVTVAPAQFRQGGSHVALNDAGQAALAWRGRTTDLAATRNPAGTWTAPTTLATNVSGAATGSVDVAIDGAGNAVAVIQRLHTVGSSFTSPLYASRRPAGGAWGPATLLSGINDSTGQPTIVADAAGTFVAAWNVSGNISLVAATSRGGGSTFGAPVAVGSNFGSISLAIAPGRAVLMWTSGGATVSSQPVP
ncbi:MAG TPA: hypothetical protein VF469_37110 [Kofleriaceae bacterium]